MSTNEIKVECLKAVIKEPKNPKWPSGCTEELVRELIDAGLLEYKSIDIELPGAGWSSMRNSIHQGEYRVSRKGHLFIEEHS